MNYRFHKLLTVLTPLALSSSIALPTAYADSATRITKVVSTNGHLEGVLIKTPKVVFYVTTYGKLAKITPNNPALIRAQRFAKALGTEAPQGKPLKIKYYPKSQFNGNGGKASEVNGIRINYYACMANNQTLTGVNNYGSTMPRINGNFPMTYNKNFQFACRSLDGNGGKVRSIGTINFTYYPNNRMNYNGGKLARVGNYSIMYHSPNSFTGKAGQLQSFGD